MTAGFVPPPYPYDRLDRFKPLAEALPGGLVDLSIGTPCDAPPPEVVAALSASNAERGYPPSIGTAPLRSAAQAWMSRRFDVDVPVAQIAACVGTKEFVATTAQLLHLRTPDRDTVLYPAVAYPTYEMSATLAGCRAVAGAPSTPAGGLDLASIDPADAARALMLWVNSPNNPTGALDDLGAAAAWGRAHAVPVFSDECYAEFTWDGPAAHDPRARHSTASSRCTRCRSARTWPVCGSASTPATPSSSTTSRRCASTSACSVPGPVQAAGVGGARRRRPRRGAARAVPAPPRAARRRRSRSRSGFDVRDARRRVLSVV